ncbi:MAG TPA: hypothetical protein VKU00_15290 [Chthonomonadaceae bacterium]|nr:hypothetical protein [Chthonomonadaceae bacterium]
MKRTEYDRVRAAERIRQSGWPSDFAQEFVRNPPGEQQALDVFEAMSEKMA